MGRIGQGEELQGLVQASLPGSSGGHCCRISCSATATGLLKSTEVFKLAQDVQKEQCLEDKQELNLLFTSAEGSHLISSR